MLPCFIVASMFITNVVDLLRLTHSNEGKPRAEFAHKAAPMKGLLPILVFLFDGLQSAFLPVSQIYTSFNASVLQIEAAKPLWEACFVPGEH